MLPAYVQPLLRLTSSPVALRFFRYVACAVRSVVGIAFPEVEITVAFLQVDVMSEPPQFVVDRFKRKALAERIKKLLSVFDSPIQYINLHIKLSYICEHSLADPAYETYSENSCHQRT